jgi:circadian clock protein KaiC
MRNCELLAHNWEGGSGVNQIQSAGSERVVSTGIPGLDYILRGGFPANHLYLIEGDPGTGKTTLALQFLLEGLRTGEKGLYVTLSETKAELNTVAESHGWSLDGIGLFELASIEQRLQATEQYTVFHPSEVELGETTSRICEEVERTQPVRVVFDSLSEMRLLARDPLRYRRQVLALKQFFAGRRCTVILLDDRTAQETDIQLQSISHGVIRLERLAVEYGGARRRLSVVKIRGLQYRDGYHDFSIQPGGLIVYPRLVAAEKRRAQAPASVARREEAKSGIAELDKLLGGGIHYGTSTLMLGPAGSGKSTLLTQYAVALAAASERVVCYLFEETRENFLERADGLGLDLRAQAEQGGVLLEQIDPAEMSPGEFSQKVRTAVEPRPGYAAARVVMIDSLNGYLNAMPSEGFLLIQMHELLTYLNEQGALTLMVLAQHGLVGAAMQTPVDMTYLADTVVLLRYFEAFGEVRQAVAVIKKRTGGHERSIREFKISPQGLQIGESLKDFEAVLTGVPAFTGKRETLIPQATQ